jgi:hypothetical protein
MYKPVFAESKADAASSNHIGFPEYELREGCLDARNHPKRLLRYNYYE